MTRFSPAFGPRAAGVLAATALALAIVPSAQAANSTAGCDAQVAEQPFLRWLDPAAYVLVPGGTVERWAGWNLEGAAARTWGNEPYYVHDEDDTWSLAIPAGSSATTAPMCVGVEHPTLRLLVRNRGSLASPLRVEVLFEDALGLRRAVTIGDYLGTSRWQPTPPLAVLANLLLLGDHVEVAFRFTAGTGGDWFIDDVYVDPFRHG